MNNTRALCINVEYSNAVASCNAIWSTDNTDTIKNSQIKCKWAFGNMIPAYLYCRHNYICKNKWKCMGNIDTDTIKESAWKWAFGQYVYTGIHEMEMGLILGNRLPAYTYTDTIRIHKISGNGHLGNIYTGIHEVEMGVWTIGYLPTYIHRHNEGYTKYVEMGIGAIFTQKQSRMIHK